MRIYIKTIIVGISFIHLFHPVFHNSVQNFFVCLFVLLKWSNVVAYHNIVLICRKFQNFEIRFLARLLKVLFLFCWRKGLYFGLKLGWGFSVWSFPWVSSSDFLMQFQSRHVRWFLNDLFVSFLSVWLCDGLLICPGCTLPLQPPWLWTGEHGYIKRMDGDSINEAMNDN